MSDLLAARTVTTGPAARDLDDAPGAAAMALRVAQVSTWETQCGIADYTANLRTALLGQGVDCDVEVIDRRRTNYMSAAELHDHFDDAARRLRGHDIVHIQHEYAFFGLHLGMRSSIEIFASFLQALRRHGVPTVVTFHTNPMFYNWRAAHVRHRVAGVYFGQMWRLKVASQFDGRAPLHAVVHSKATRLAFMRSGLNGSAITVMSHGVDAAPPLGDGAGAAVRAELGIPADALVVGLFGFMSRYKGYGTALDALRRLPSDTHLLLLGGPHPFSPESALEDVLGVLGKRPKLRERVHLAGFVPPGRLAAFQGAVDICIAPYAAESGHSASGALMWALASGRPVIASKIPAFIELNEEYDCLLLTSPGAARELAFRVEELRGNPAERHRLTSNAAQYCHANSWAVQAERTRSLYGDVQRRP